VKQEGHSPRWAAEPVRKAADASGVIHKRFIHNLLPEINYHNSFYCQVKFIFRLMVLIAPFLSLSIAQVGCSAVQSKHVFIWLPDLDYHSRNA
jgi:hypothetical protein